MGRAVGIDQDGVGDVLHDGGAGKRLGGPSGEGADERDGRVLRAVGGDGEGLVRKDPKGVLGCGIGGGFAGLDPVDGGEDDEVMRAVEIDPEQAARGTEVDDAAGDGDVTVVVGEDAAGNGEVVERGAGERAVLAVDGRAPEGLRSGEELVEEGTEAVVLDEVVLAALFVGVVGSVLPDPFDVFGRGLRGLGRGECGRKRGDEQESDSELEEAAHFIEADPLRG